MGMDDSAARFTGLYRREYPAVYRFLALRTDNPADIAHEAFMAAWRRIDEIPSDETAARAWLFTAARNHLRVANRTAIRGDKLAARVGQHSQSEIAGPEDGVVASQHLGEAWRQLPVEYQEVLALVGGEGLTVTQAARVLGISLPTFRARLRRARRLLRELLADVVEDHPPDRANGINRETTSTLLAVTAAS